MTTSAILICLQVKAILICLQVKAYFSKLFTSGGLRRKQVAHLERKQVTHQVLDRHYNRQVC